MTTGPAPGSLDLVFPSLPYIPYPLLILLSSSYYTKSSHNYILSTKSSLKFCALGGCHRLLKDNPEIKGLVMLFRLDMNSEDQEKLPSQSLEYLRL